MKLLAGAAAAALVLASGASAQTIISNPSGVIRNFDIANLTPVLTELGVGSEQRLGPNNQPFLVANVNGYFINIVPMACQGANFTQCLGLQTFALNESPTVSQQSINAFNLRYAFVSAGPVANGYYLSRYDIADYGIARGNVQSSLSSFYSLAGVASGELGGASGQTVSTIGYADDMSAGLLNEASGKSLGADVSVNPADPIAATHLKEIRATPEFVKAFAAFGTAAVNKIDNVVKD